MSTCCVIPTRRSSEESKTTQIAKISVVAKDWKRDD